MQKLKKFKTSPPASEEGLVLFDQSLKPIAFDRGAAAILNYPQPPNGKIGLVTSIPREILDFIGRSNPAAGTGVTTRVRSGRSEYRCRAYLVESSPGSVAKPIVALHLEKISSTSDVVREVGLRFGLTEREQEVLSGISTGLTSNEIAEKMRISPHTVRSFFRLIMIKMGVTNRSGITAAMLQPGQRS
jgi:DNA-binding CsgD family transcriptional regulator